MDGKSARAAAVLLLAGSLAYAAPAGATPAGRRCALQSVTDPTVAHGETQSGHTSGGPIADDATSTATVTLRCTIQVGAANSTHAGVDAAFGASSGTGAAVVAAVTVAYVLPEGQPVYLCSEVTVDGMTSYWDEVAGAWSSNSAASCDEAVVQEVLPGPFAPVLDVAGPIMDGVVDPVACPVLAAVLPPDGDVPGVWDCPPYDTLRRGGEAGGGIWIVCAGSEGATACV